MIRASLPRQFSLILLTMLVLPEGALAAEEPPVVKAMLDSAALHTSGRPTYSTLEVDADGTIRLKGITMTLKGASPDVEQARYEIEELSLSGIAERSAGKFEVDQATWKGFTMQMGALASAAFPLITGRTLFINQPSAQPTDLERMQSASIRGKEFVIPEALILASGQSISLERVKQTWDGDPDTGAGLTNVEVASLKLPGEMFKQADGSNPLSAVGYDGLEFGLVGKGLTTVAGDATGFDFEFKLTGKDMGALVVNLAADGVPASMLSSLSSGEPDVEKLAQHAQAISLRRAKIRFEDASVTRRLLAFAAKTQGTDEASLIGNATGAAQAALMGLNDPTLASQTAGAIAAFLKNPGSITLNLAPAQPVLGAQLMQAAQNPAALLQMLAVSVTAND